MKKKRWKFIGMLLFALLILTAIAAGYAWQFSAHKDTPAKKIVPLCGKAN
jgi:hypothetical protein